MNFEAAASEVFQILRSHNYEVLLFDAEHNQVFEPSEARRFFAKPVNLLVSINDDGDDSSIRLYLSKSTGVKKVLGLIQAQRMMATKYKMVFNVREYDKQLAPKDFATQASVNEQEETKMNLVEGMYGTSRSSYLKLENARMIVRHSTRINENILGARGRNVETIHIEDKDGQRYLMPTQQLAPARAMAHHVDNGGSWADDVGQQIARMAQDFADLGAASRHIGHYAPELNESAPAIRETVREAARSMRKTFEGVCRKTRYSEVCESILAKGETLNEGDDEGVDRVAELAEMLNTPAVQLSERTLSTVARVMREAASMVEAVEPVVSIQGQTVNKAAWEALRQDHLDLTGEVQIDSNPLKTFKNVIGVTRDSTLANFFAHVLKSVAGPQANPALKNVVARVLKIVGGNRRDPEAPAQLPAVREFLEWARSHDVERLMEMDRLPQPDDGDTTPALDGVIDSFDYNAFMAWASPTFHHDVIDQLDDEEKTFLQDDVVKTLDAYLQSEVEDTNPGLNTESAAQHLAPEVIKYMQADGYLIQGAEMGEDACLADRNFLSGDDEIEENCGECEGDDMLTAEDVLLPTNQGDDLVGEVTKATVDTEDGEKAPDDDYLNRLQSLAGMRGRNQN